MKTYEYIRKNDIDAYKKLVVNFGFNINKKRKIELGDSVENLMRHDGYKRVGRKG